MVGLEEGRLTRWREIITFPQVNVLCYSNIQRTLSTKLFMHYVTVICCLRYCIMKLHDD